MKNTQLFMILLSVCAMNASARYVTETISLNRGWNAVYVESTPAANDCDAVFDAHPSVKRVACYFSDAYESTRQLRDDGSEILQKPLSYHVWIRGDAAGSTLTKLNGGYAYLVYADEAGTVSFLGEPCPPRMTWRKAGTDGDGYMNLAPVSLPETATGVTLGRYFGAGPYGASGGTAYGIAGTDETQPQFLPLTLFGGKSVKVEPGRAYALTANSGGDWPGVVDVRGTSVGFGTGNQSVITVRNNGGTTNVFEFSVARSATDLPASEEFLNALSRRIDLGVVDGHVWTNVTAGAWRETFAPGESKDVVFALNRKTITDAGADYSAVLSVADATADGSAMRVRLPVEAAVAPIGDGSENAVYPAGLWVGELQLVGVNKDDDPTPLPAGGTMKATVLLHVSGAGKIRLLQRVSVAADSNGVARLWRTMDAAKANAAAGTVPRRISSVILGTRESVVEDSANAEFGGDTPARFTYTIGARSVDNPFRHPWHPDHDGVNAKYDGYAPDGDDLENYLQGTSVVPELWSITNTLTIAWKQEGEKIYECNEDETSIALLDWRVDGLKHEPIFMRGALVMKRALANGKLEEE